MANKIKKMHTVFDKDLKQIFDIISTANGKGNFGIIDETCIFLNVFKLL